MSDAAFWDRLARKYAKQPIGDMDAYETTMERTRQYLGADDSVLEIGCGTGLTALLLADAVADYHGTDISPDMITIANEKLVDEPKPSVRFSVSDSLVSDEGRGTLDAVLGFNILHLVDETEATASRVRDLLKPGGYFISKTPCLGHKWYLRPLIAAMRLVGKAPFVRSFKTSELENLVTDAGFEIVETGHYPPKLPSLFIVARKI